MGTTFLAKRYRTTRDLNYNTGGWPSEISLSSGSVSAVSLLVMCCFLPRSTRALFTSPSIHRVGSAQGQSRAYAGRGSHRPAVGRAQDVHEAPVPAAHGTRAPIDGLPMTTRTSTSAAVASLGRTSPSARQDARAGLAAALRRWPMRSFSWAAPHMWHHP